MTSIVIIIVIALCVIALIVGIMAATGMRMVPQGQRWVVERFGQYRTTLDPGLNFIVPFMDKIPNTHRLTTKQIVLDIPRQDVITKDNVTLKANAAAYISIIHPDKAIYGIENYEEGISTLVQTSLRSIIGGMNLDCALSSRDEIKEKLKADIAKDIEDWGISLRNVEIQDIIPSEDMQKAMEEQAAAERQRRAAVTRSEGERQAAILEAEGRLEASKRDAEAQVVLAKASEEAIRLVTDAMGDGEMPAVYLLGEKYIKSMKDMAESDNAKTVVLPADIMSTIQGIAGNKFKS